MKKIAMILAGMFVLLYNLTAQSISLKKENVQPVGVLMSIEKLANYEVVKVIKDSAVKESDEPTYVTIKGKPFTNGTIEVKVLSRLVKNAPAFARGFIGVAFRVAADNSKFECIYIRPTNGRADDQVRRNHSTQYFSYPDFKFDRLRKEAPEKYESYADMELDRWITLRIEVKDAKARLFIDDQPQPVLIVNDLKHGATASGGIALWVETGTEGYFRDLKITHK